MHDKPPAKQTQRRGHRSMTYGAHGSGASFGSISNRTERGEKMALVDDCFMVRPDAKSCDGRHGIGVMRRTLKQSYTSLRISFSQSSSIPNSAVRSKTV
jgi:hypothetical protein